MALPFVKIKFVLNEKERNSRILLDATIEKNDKNEIPCDLISECCLEFIKHKEILKTGLLCLKRVIHIYIVI